MDVATSDKRTATRKALIGAARDLVFEKGHDRIAVQEITKAARLATGTYYNYFDTKQDIFVAVAEDLRDQIALEFESTRETIKDPAMLIAMTLKYYFHQALDNQRWQNFTRCTGQTELILEQQASQRMGDIARGVTAGRFRVDDLQFTSSLISGMVCHIVSSIRNGTSERCAIEYTVRSVLQMLGLPGLVSKALTQTPLPPMAAPKKSVAAPTTQSGITRLADYATISRAKT